MEGVFGPMRGWGFAKAGGDARAIDGEVGL